MGLITFIALQQRQEADRREAERMAAEAAQKAAEKRQAAATQPEPTPTQGAAPDAEGAALGWTARIPPDRYVARHPDGPQADLARRILAAQAQQQDG